MPPSAVQDVFPSTPGKVKMERNNYFGRVSNRWHSSGSGRYFFWMFVSVALMFYAFFHISAPPAVQTGLESRHFGNRALTWGGSKWEKQVRHSARTKRENGMVVLVTGAAGFVGTHVSLALKKRGDGVVGLDNFNSYYDPSLKRARQELLEKQSVFIVDGDVNNSELLAKLFSMVPFTHVMHLAAQAGVRYAMQNPASYVNSNIAGLVTLFEACKSANPQPSIVWASSSSVYGLNSKVPFSEMDRTDQPASLYAATKKAGEAIAHSYNHIYGLSITGLRFFTVYGPYGRPDMAYFSFTKDILQGKPINIYQGPDQTDLARDFTYIDDIVKGCLGALDTALLSTGTGGKKRGPAQLRVYNLGNTSPVTVPELVSILEKHLKVKAKKNFVKMPRNGDVPFTHANVTLARNELRYNPSTDLYTGLKKFVKWYESYYGLTSGLSGSRKNRAIESS
ncbi:hypothetical protein SELMODRAFT_77268 [Selaginella moellendorffii]|uniref:UDP-glucuronate 4-epimerase n=1 Tax=Selaginella moellendorffii TaxID=88036 RepID=D8QSQ1_SELML|nr:UDP-glucuronate 4-epimerase 1 [Selaginella moellendorffii]XP_024537565.1 UDP-glucuronate 4-epimerase 1 [Selaginella moellendorffii]XP_024537572.1 UDP-glucuronate 4-epimerase 1 [Selaginella moellendorffii]EFJ37477.1 hypothetical protein SELMODRAFT_77268 [Selaginella moellendorffii]|eukprot:XP_002962217.1 UDP-glucuronate 4-epimerase 1 [Selaginella moellendorffii]